MVASKLCQTIPRRMATVALNNITLKRSLAIHFQSYPLALAEKEQLAKPVLSLVTMTPPNQQHVIWSHEMLNQYGEKLNRCGKIFSSGTRNISNQIVVFWGYLLGFSYSHIISSHLFAYHYAQNHASIILQYSWNKPSCIQNQFVHHH